MATLCICEASTAKSRDPWKRLNSRWLNAAHHATGALDRGPEELTWALQQRSTRLAAASARRPGERSTASDGLAAARVDAAQVRQGAVLVGRVPVVVGDLFAGLDITQGIDEDAQTFDLALAVGG